MFKKMYKVFEEKLSDGHGGYQWNDDALAFYNALYELALADVLSIEQWKQIAALALDSVSSDW